MADRDQWKARAADEARRCLENGTARQSAEAERDALRAELRFERDLKNELVLKAYPAMDERDELRRWIEELRDWASQVPDMPGIADQKTIGYQMAEDFVRRACDDVLGQEAVRGVAARRDRARETAAERDALKVLLEHKESALAGHREIEQMLYRKVRALEESRDWWRKMALPLAPERADTDREAAESKSAIGPGLTRSARWRGDVTKIGRAWSPARAVTDGWAWRFYDSDEWEVDSRREDAVRVLEALCEPSADEVWETLSEERAKRQKRAARQRSGEGEDG